MITRFEDLSNELLYEIFDYFDICYTYETFSYLNNRFYHLIHYSSLPLNLSFSLMSKTTFQYRCKYIVLPNIHRILSIHLSNLLLIDYFFTSCTFDYLFTRLESFTLSNVKSENLISILTNLAFLPRLFSLNVTCIDKIRSRSFIYYLIISLPVLKYCQLYIDIWNEDFDYLIPNNRYSSLEYLTIGTKCSLNELCELLIYTPQLKRLSCTLSASNNTLNEISQIPVCLNTIHLQLEDISFDEFQWLISSFSLQLQVLSVSTQGDIEFLDAHRWQQFISCQMPVLKKFYFQYQTMISGLLVTPEYYYDLMKEFDSSFWHEKQWFFTYQHYKSNDGDSWITFYSTKPYRWSRYDFHEVINQHHETGVNLADEVNFYNYQTLAQYPIQFTQTTRLNFSQGDITQNPLFISDLTHLFCPSKITELIISNEKFRFEHLLLLLHQFPNIQFLTIPQNILYLSLPQTDTNRLIINKNKIMKVTILNQCTLEDIQILLRWCPNLQSLDIEIEKENLQLIIYFLLSKNTKQIHRNRLPLSFDFKNISFWKQEYNDCISCRNKKNLNSSIFSIPCNHHLSLLCCRNINYKMIEKFRIMINREKLLNDYAIEYLDEDMYLWW
ncbi:unnamed protein product [Adineta steineri]|uniref:F-box domain-containing protein n=2 Tax=Adineta steineri TaxID=433720 RepID=A0A813S7N0_9BILA|nr:unnamed protein product [Adineta steineri]